MACQSVQCGSEGTLAPLMHVWNRPDDADALHGILHPYLEDMANQKNIARNSEDILDDLRVLEGQEPMLHNSNQIERHLKELNKLRIEVKRDHPRDADLLKEVEAAIQRGINGMNDK